MKLNDGLCVDVREMAWPVVLWIVPPVHVDAVDVHVPPLPLTVRPPLVPVLLRAMPLTAPLAVMLRKVRPLAPMVVLATVRAVPVVVVSVLALPVRVMVPPPVAVKAGLVPV